MFVTVAICTWNRAALLDRTLTRMGNLKPPPGGWELLVVDNNSPDDTAAVLARHAAAGRLPLRWLFEPKQGQSNARNAAVGEARGDLIVWTDDDVLVPADWLERYAAVAAGFPDAAFLGGAIRPWYEVPPPAWLARAAAAHPYLYALVDHGDADRRLADREYVHGANMAFRTDVQRRHLYDPARGHTGRRMAGGDEVDVIDRVRAAGGSGAYVGRAAVEHFVPADRTTAQYVWDRTRWLHEGLHDPATDAGCPTVFGRPRYAVRQYLTSRLRAAVLAPGRSDRWLAAYLKAAEFRGRLDAVRRPT